MNRFAKLAGVVLTAWALAGAAPAGSGEDPASYAIRIPVTPADGAPLQRLAIPAAALATARTADLSDLRIFDAAGKAMPMARTSPAPAPARRDVLPALPILGTADALNVTGVSLRLDDSGHARVSQVEGTVTGGPATSSVLGALLDARAIDGTAESLTLDADLPAAQPVTFTIEASTDLKDWRPLGERVIYRAAPVDGSPSAPPIALGDATLHGDYLRVTWRAASRLLSPVTVRRAVLVTRAGSAATTSFVDAILPLQADPHAIEFVLPFATAVARIRIVPTGNDAVVPVRILGRLDREQPWTLLGEGTAARPNNPAVSQGVIVLNDAAYRQMRIEADRRLPGFTSPPTIGLGFGPREVVFLAAGRRPFVLAAGRATAVDAYLPLASMMTQAADGRLPTATTKAMNTVVQLAPAGETGSSRQVLLWAVLLAATAVLGALAWLLWRRGGVVT